MATNSEAAAQARGRFLNQLNSRGIKPFRKEKGKNAAEVYWAAQKNKTYLIYILYSAADIKWWGMNEPVLKRLDQTHPSKYFCALVTDTDEVAILGPGEIKSFRATRLASNDTVQVTGNDSMVKSNTFKFRDLDAFLNLLYKE